MIHWFYNLEWKSFKYIVGKKGNSDIKKILTFCKDFLSLNNPEEEGFWKQFLNQQLFLFPPLRTLLLFNSFTNDNLFLDWSKLKALIADDKINMTEKLEFVLGQIEKIVGKGENACYQHFLLYPQCFQVFFSKVIKCRDCVVKI